MRRYWVETFNISEGHVLIDGDLFHHIFTVCRQELGSQFELLVDGKALLVEVKDVKKKTALAQVLEERSVRPLPQPHIHLALSLPKFSTMDSIIEKSVELGVYKIHPFLSDYSFIKDPKKLSENKVKRWQKIIVGATQQSGRGDLMVVEPLVSLADLLAEFHGQPSAKGLFFYEGEASKDIRESLPTMDQSEIQEVWLFVGSEGGYSQNEAELFKQNSLPPLTLGEQILRVETACVMLVGIIKYELSLLKG